MATEKKANWFRRVAAFILSEFLRLFRLLLYLLLVIVAVLAYQFYAPIISNTNYIPKFNVDAFSDQWDITGPFDAWSTTKELANLCEVAYEPLDIAKERFKELDFKTVRYFNADGYAKQPVYAVTGVRNEKTVLIIVFPGSNDPSDWLQNVNFYSGGAETDGIHQGFAGAFADNREQLKEVAKNSSVDQIWITGHSMGGALAVICAEYFSNDEELNSKLKGVFTFAQPMVARSDYAQLLSEKLGDRHVHFINDQDIVPRLGPGYVHTGMMIYLHGGKVLIPDQYFKEAIEKVSKADVKAKDDIAMLFEPGSKIESVDQGFMGKLELVANEIRVNQSPRFGFEEMLAQTEKIETARIKAKYSGDLKTRKDSLNDPKTENGGDKESLVFESESERFEAMAKELRIGGANREKKVRRQFQKEEAKRRLAKSKAEGSFADLLGFHEAHSIISYMEKIDAVIEKLESRPKN